MPVPQTIRLKHIWRNTLNKSQKVNVHDVDHFLFRKHLLEGKSHEMTYLKSFEIQHPNPEFEGLIYLLQDLTTEQNLELTKEGLDRIIQHIDDNFVSNESIDCELQNNYDQGYDRGYADGKDEGYDDGYSEGKDEGYDSGYEDGKKDGFFDGKEAGYNSGYYDGCHTHETN